MLAPPQTYSTWPVMKEFSGSAKNMTARATSSLRPKSADRNCFGNRRFALASGGDNLPEHFGVLDRTRRDDVHGNAERRKLQCPGAGHADHAGFGRRIDGARLQAERRPRRHQHNAPELPLPHARQHRLHNENRRAEVKLREIVQILLTHVGEEIGPDHSGIMDHSADGVLFGDAFGGLFGRSGVGEVDLDRVQRRVRPIRPAPRQRYDLITGIEHSPANRCANAGATAGDDGDLAFAHPVAHMKS